MQTSDPSHNQHPSHNQDPTTEVEPSSTASAEGLSEDLTIETIETLGDLASLVDYSLLNTLDVDPDAEASGANHTPRQVYSGHFVPVTN